MSITKKVKIEKGTRVCSAGLGGCERTIKQGEEAWLQMRSKKKRGAKRRYLCEQCYDKKAY